MTGKKGSAPDPARSLALLWGPQTRPGRSGVTVRSIVTAALELADTEGLDAVSMRAVAERLKVGTMTLYTHVPGRSELTDLMLDSIYGELYADVAEPSRQPGGWRGAMEFVARRNWEVMDAHPWMHELNVGRTGFGPNSTLRYEAELRPLDGLGLTDVEMDSALALVLSHVEFVARQAAAHRRTQQESGQTDEEWWVSTAPLLERVMAGSAEAFPLAARVGTSAGQEHRALLAPDHALAFGLARILDGLALLIDSRA
ncbi:TetR/AcrR family transcriptional regulator [Kribbella deserti]|uniref:TetR/AcrR family transcriptional regulator n=1 Tax=Kribbella deserti TaxID=1926257 RepID=A0ABV6QTI6_9ACTN